MSEAIEPPRGLVIAAGAWIIVCGLASFGTQLPLHLSPSTLAPQVRMLLLTFAAGMLVAWPLVRLSQPPRDRTIARTILDAITLACLWQLLLWPLRLATPWPLERTLLINLFALVTLAGVTGLVVAATAWRSSIMRGLAMIGCILVALGIQLPLAALGFPLNGLSTFFPGGIPSLLSLMNSPASLPDATDWKNIVTISIVNGALCVVGLLIAATASNTASNQASINSNTVATGRRVG